ncbi:hypothetical protein [Goodfellowiella coeruleoviolacea]|uniref:Uncharacterized protein n=1 Tax=Goodfellowiella coeruleoviolacea TaxID=334858 RepID=A0AAE3KHK3_9PSEU|nr:hypothetical protein [Goodfellowiella coeruleoviolacea]MCP2167435.1 hypothetical protein [Goodfellowiella coeruleoviolacea]
MAEHAGLPLTLLVGLAQPLALVERFLFQRHTHRRGGGETPGTDYPVVSVS